MIRDRGILYKQIQAIRGQILYVLQKQNRVIFWRFHFQSLRKNIRSFVILQPIILWFLFEVFRGLKIFFNAKARQSEKLNNEKIEIKTIEYYQST